MRWHVFGMALLLAVVLGGCSAIRTVYNQADHVIAWHLNDYFDLDDAQKRFFHSRFASFHAWHRTHQLRNYAAFLQTAEQRLHRGPVPEDANWVREQIRMQARTLLAQVHEDVAALLASLSERQVAHARQRFERDNRKFAQERGLGAAPDEQRRLRARRDIEQIEHWTGPLDREQRNHVSTLSWQLPLDAEMRQRERVRRQQAFLALLAQRNDGERFKARLQQWLLDWETPHTVSHQAAVERHAQARATMWIDVYSGLGPEERLKVLERLRGYTDAMRELAIARKS